MVQLASLDLFNLLSYTTQDHPSRDGTIYRGLGPAATNINLLNVHIDMLTGQSDGGSSSVEAPTSQVTL